MFLSVFSYSQDLADEVRKIMEDGGYTESTSQYAYISEGKTAYHWKTFYEGNDYAIVGFSEDDDCYDVDLYLYDTDGSSVIKKSATDESIELIEFSPHSTEELKVVIKNYDSYSSSREYKVKFIIFYK